jgi:hypothetical protein
MELAEVPRHSNTGLFAALIGDPVVLYQHYLEHPDLFDTETVTLLVALVTRQKTLSQLTQSELNLLDQATVTFAQHSPTSKDSQNKQRSAPLHPQNTSDHEAQTGTEEVVWDEAGAMRLSYPPAPVDIPTIPTSWWDKGPGGGLR